MGHFRDYVAREEAKIRRNWIEALDESVPLVGPDHPWVKDDHIGRNPRFADGRLLVALMLLSPVAIAVAFWLVWEIWG